jgi:hypothetical protein
MIRVQILSILTSLVFLGFIARFIVRGKLREEYAIIWVICTILLIFFSFWREGLEKAAHMFGVFEAPNLVFTAAIFAILIYLLHLSMVVSRLHEQNKKMAQHIALFNAKSLEKEKKSESTPPKDN